MCPPHAPSQRRVIRGAATRLCWMAAPAFFLTLLALAVTRPGPLDNGFARARGSSTVPAAGAEVLRLRGGHAALSANAEGMGARASEKAADRRPATEQRKRPLPAGVSEAMKAKIAKNRQMRRGKVATDAEEARRQQEKRARRRERDVRRGEKSQKRAESSHRKSNSEQQSPKRRPFMRPRVAAGTKAAEGREGRRLNPATQATGRIRHESGVSRGKNASVHRREV